MIALTGASGLIGWHSRVFLEKVQGFPVTPVPRAAWSNNQDLLNLISKARVIVHCAGASRGPASDVYRTNIKLAEVLSNSIVAGDKPKHVIYANSIRAGEDSPYGRSKLKAAEILASATAAVGGAFSDIRLPHVFGECGRPFHNSVVSTWCYQLASGQSPKITSDDHVHLVHAQDVARVFLSLMESPRSLGLRGKTISLPGLLARLERLHRSYGGIQLPRITDRLDLALFNTLRSHMFPVSCQVDPSGHQGTREYVLGISRSVPPRTLSTSVTRPGLTQGNHFHRSMMERLVVVSGRARVKIRCLYSSNVKSLTVEGANPSLIDIPTLHTYSITNVGQKPLVTCGVILDLLEGHEFDTYAEPL